MRTPNNFSIGAGAAPAPPYAHQEFPRELHKADGSAKVVQNAEEQAAAEAEGWVAGPVAPVADVDQK